MKLNEQIEQLSTYCTRLRRELHKVPELGFDCFETQRIILRELEQKAEHVSWNQDHRQTWFVLFSMGGYTDELKQLAEGRADLLLVDDRK